MTDYSRDPSIIAFLANVGGGGATHGAEGLPRRGPLPGARPEWLAVAARVLKRRRELGMNQKALARRLHVHPYTWGRWENGLREFGRELLGRLAFVLRCKITDLTGGTDPCE